MNSLRADFEAWMIGERAICALEKEGEGGETIYTNMYVQEAWEAWQAAHQFYIQMRPITEIKV